MPDTHKTSQPSPTAASNGIGFKAVAKYALLPGIFPSVGRVASRFGRILHVFTSVLGSVGLIDRNHPCLRPENAGAYRFTDVIGLAAQNVVFDRKHLPQTIMFFTVILTLVLMIAMFGTAIFGVLFHTAEAQAQFFSNPTSGNLPAPASEDWAYQFLHRVFGSTGLSSIWDGRDTNIGFFSVVFKEMLKTYSFALLVIAVFIVIYIITNVLVESARSGKPFGDKFDSIWAPIRLATAIGLLVPIGAGYNSAQLITFQVADWGSALATNVWVAGLNKFDGRGLVEAADPDPNYRFVRAYFLIRLCMEGWNNFADAQGTGDSDRVRIWTVPNAITEKKVMRFKYGTENDKTFCGEIEVPQLTAEEITALPNLPSRSPPQYIQHLAYSIRNLHSISFNKLRCSGMEDDVKAIVKRFQNDKNCSMEQISEINSPVALTRWITGPNGYWSGLGYNGSRFFRKAVGVPSGACTNGGSPVGYTDGNLTDNFSLAGREMINTMRKGTYHGWAAAGSFYLLLSQSLGKVSEAVGLEPKATLMPRIMNYQLAVPTEPDTQPITLTSTEIDEQCKKSEYEASCQLYTMLSRADTWFKGVPLKDAALAKELDYDGKFAVQMRDTTQTKSMASAHEGSEIYALAGLRGIHRIADDTMNPISSLVEMGNSFRESGYILYTLAVVFSSSIFGSSALGSILQTFGSIYLMAGFTLSFVVPMMPFLNFAFGVLEWVMTVFEAVVGMPLWALSFITREGGWFEGKPSEGIMLLFEMFLRPTILIFSLIGALIIFASGVKFFNEAFDLYLSASADELDANSMFNNLGYTVIYVFIMYSLGNSSFKLIQKMPDMFLRWYGKNPNSFGGIMTAGVADVNPYMVANYAKDLGSGMAGVGVASVNQGHKALDTALTQNDLKKEQEKVSSQFSRRQEAASHAQEARQQATDSIAAAYRPGSDAETQRRARDDEAIAERAEEEYQAIDKDYEKSVDRYNAITGGGEIDEKTGQVKELTPDQWKAFQGYKSESNALNRRWDVSRLAGKTNRYDRMEEQIAQKVEAAPKERAKKAAQDQRQLMQDQVLRDDFDNIGNRYNPLASAAGSGAPPEERGFEELSSLQQDVVDAKRNYGEDSDAYKQVKAVYEYRTGGHDYSKDLLPETLDRYRDYMKRPANERDKMEDEMLGPEKT